MWTDSRIVLSWLSGNPRWFKVFVGNRVSTILSFIPPCCWRHVAGLDNPANLASRGMFPLELLKHEFWWHGPNWLRQASSQWPCQPKLVASPVPTEEREISMFVSFTERHVLPILEATSSCTRLVRVTAWIRRFDSNCCRNDSRIHGHLSVDELLHAKGYWIATAQHSAFLDGLLSLRKGLQLPSKSCLLPLHPVLDEHGLI